MQVLVVQDNLSVVRLITQTIERWGHSVEASDTGKGALRRVRQKKFDLVFLDIFLPDCKGHEIIPRIREIWPDIGVVTMTGYNSRELEWEVRQLGIIYFLTMPFRLDVIKEILDHTEIKKKKGGFHHGISI
jgi:DNA-binding NtrC family response regulator